MPIITSSPTDFSDTACVLFNKIVQKRVQGRLKLGVVEEGEQPEASQKKSAPKKSRVHPSATVPDPILGKSNCVFFFF